MYNADNYPIILNSIITDSNLIYVFDNILNQSELAYLQQYPWSERSWCNGWNDWPNSRDDTVMPMGYDLCSKMFNHLKQIDPHVQLEKHIGSYYVLRDITNEFLDDNIHRDFYDFKNVWSGVFHIIGNHGPTMFYKDFTTENPCLEINFVPGRLIIFPSLFAHRAGNTIPGHLRLTHTIRLLVKSKTLDYTTKIY